MICVALGIQYTGTRYSGWQSQPEQPLTVQHQLQEALSFVANEPIRVICAGRTDAGVHATAQVVHFNTQAVRSMRSWILGVNSKLPADISVQWAQTMPAHFHARFSAISRRYLYVIYNRQHRPGLYANHVTWCLEPLLLSAMNSAAKHLVGEHDFNAFRSVHCQSKQAVRTVHHLKCRQHGPLVLIDIQASGFLHHMVRNIAGVLIPIGTGKANPDWARVVLESKDRTRAGVTAPADGLYFTAVDYGEAFQLPAAEFEPFFLASILV